MRYAHPSPPLKREAVARLDLPHTAPEELIQSVAVVRKRQSR
jgi:hypothetical protein